MRLFGFDITRDGVSRARRPGDVLRGAARNRAAVLRNFEAASTPLLAGPTGNTNISLALSSQLVRLRNMSRIEARNNPLGARYVKLCHANIVGPRGINVQAQAKNPDGTPDAAANNAVERAWREWGMPGNCSDNGRDSWCDIQRMVISTMITDGEVLVQETASGPHKYALQLIDPDLLDIKYNGQYDPTGNRVVTGVEVDAKWRPVAVHLLKQAHLNPYTSYSYSTDRQRIPLSQIRHIFMPEIVGQLRGIPWLVPGLLRSQMLHGYAEAALVTARAGAAKGGFFTSPDGEGLGDEEDGGGSFIDYAEPGHFSVLPPGYEYTPNDPSYPRGEYAPFSEDHKRDISAAWGVGYNSLTNDLRSVSYSSIRTAVLEDREHWKLIQEFLIERLVQPVFERWLLHALAMGKVTMENGSPLPVAKYDKFKSASFRGRRWSWVDPQKDVAASVQAIENKLTSRRRVIQDMGLDPEEVWSELEQEDQLFQGADNDR